MHLIVGLYCSMMFTCWSGVQGCGESAAARKNCCRTPYQTLGVLRLAHPSCLGTSSRGTTEICNIMVILGIWDNKQIAFLDAPTIQPDQHRIKKRLAPTRRFERRTAEGRRPRRPDPTSKADLAKEPRVRCSLEGPSAQYVRTLVPKAMKGMVLGPESVNIGYLDPLGSCWLQARGWRAEAENMMQQKPRRSQC